MVVLEIMLKHNMLYLLITIEEVVTTMQSLVLKTKQLAQLELLELL
jgi:hypothetical protein